MLTEQQLAAIGRLTLAFNQVEIVIDAYAGGLLGAIEVRVAQFILDREQNITRKVSLLAGILEALLKEHPSLAEATKKAKDALQKVGNLAVRRNDIVHSLEFTDPKGEGALFNKWKWIQPACDVSSLDALAAETKAVAMSIGSACADLQRKLDRARKEKRDRSHNSSRR